MYDILYTSGMFIYNTLIYYLHGKMENVKVF